jgi:hypothetical protein
MITLFNTATHLIVTGGLLGLLVVVFVIFFLMPGVLHWIRLRKVMVQLTPLKLGTKPETLKKEFNKIFSQDKQLTHLWNEYQDTLHVQRENRDGQMEDVSIRSTVLADTYFNEQFVVDSRLRTEFFKHVPGIFTGLGIIGTFSGLIEGLRHFQVSDNAATVRAGLESLMHAVGDAFVISALAIAAAMLATFLEKLLLSALYGKTEAIAHGIDARFESGAGEDYLSRLVNASESSASQTKILKDALVRDLGDVLKNLTIQQIKANQHLHGQLAQRIEESANRQTESAHADNQQLGSVIAQSIQDSLRDSLAKIAGAVEQASGDQSAKAVQMLGDVMASFSQQLSELFGGQINNINAVNQQAAKSMQDAVAALYTLVGKLEESGRKTTDDMAARIIAAIEAMNERQASANKSTEDLIAQIRLTMRSSQAETQQKLQDMLDVLGQQMAALLDKLRKSHEDSVKGAEGRAEKTDQTVLEMTESVQAVLKEIAASSKAMEKSVATLTDATKSSVNKMHEGANRLDEAATHFASAGERVSAVMGQAATVSGKLTELTGALTSSASSLQTGLNDYKAQRDSVAELLREVRQTVELAKKEASLTGDVLQRIEASAAKLGQAQKAADEYLDGVTDVLVKSSEAFRSSVTNTLDKVNRDFHTQLSTAVALLASSVQELEVTLASLAPKG